MGKKKKEPEVRLPAIKQLPSGAWHTRVLIGERRVSITKDTYEECASEYLALKHGVMDAKKKTSSKSKTLSGAVDEYIQARDGILSPATISGYRKDARNTFQQAMRWNVYTTPDARWQEAIRQERKKGRSAKYIKNAWSLMSAAIAEVTGSKPKVMLFPKDGKARQYLKPEQIDIFVAAIKGSPAEIPALLALSSLRRSELLALKWENVDLARQTIKVQGAIVQTETGFVEKTTNKTDRSQRTVPIIPPLLDALNASNRDSEYVVTLGANAIIRRIKKICADNGLPAVCLHGLRHSFASLAYHLQIPEMIAAEIGGWKDLGTMHKIYTHLAEDDIAARAKQLSDYFLPKK